MKPRLAIELKRSVRSGTLGLKELLNYMIDSDLFDISNHDETIKAMRSERATILFYNDKKIYLDLWEYNTPTYTGGVYDGDFDLIIKIQHNGNVGDENFEKKCHRKKILQHLTPEERKEFRDKIVPWTFFPSRLMRKYVGKENEIEKLPIEQFGFFCGKAWKSRAKIKQRIENTTDIEYIKSSQEMRKGRPLGDAEYIRKMQTSKFGIVLAGRCSNLTEPKNRREIDYMMLKKPILMNYKPTYYNPLVEGKHYIYIDPTTNFNEIEDKYDVDEIAQNGYQWYLDNATPDGAVKTFLQMMQDRFGE